LTSNIEYGDIMIGFFSILQLFPDKFISLRKSFHFGLDMEAETITVHTHICNNTSLYEYNQSLTIDETAFSIKEKE
jgi:hypothetical protein